jgi:hypothetical protein
MTKAQAVKLSSGELDLLNQIEELRGRLLHDQGIRERISQRAYELYERRGGEPGRDVEDWVAAENEILSPLIEQAMSRPAATAQSQKSQALRMSRQTTARKTSGLRKTTKLSSGKESSSLPKEAVPPPKRDSSKTASPRGGKKKLESEPDTQDLKPLG